MQENPFLALHEISKSVLALLSGTESNQSGRFEVSDDHHRMLNFLHGSADKAWKIVESFGVELVKGDPSGRSIFRVYADAKGSTSSFEYYLCSLDGPASFCTCHYFLYDVVQREKEILCKHLLAAELAKACGTVKQVAMPDEELGIMLTCTDIKEK